MIKSLENIIKNHNEGLFLLDPPTGFGKTTVVVELIRRFLKHDSIFQGRKKIFFVTNLINNLPVSKVLEGLNESEREVCFQAKATVEHVLDNLLCVNIDNDEVTNSKEYIQLKKEIESYFALKSNLEIKHKDSLKDSLEILKQKISKDTEPAFRNYIKIKFFHNKSAVERRKFMQENKWMEKLYPICNLDDYKVVFLTTQKFILPIDTFRRPPFYLYSSNLVKNSIVFVDEFDSTKEKLLDQIVQEGLKNKIDIVALFLDIHFALQNLKVPQKLLNTSNYHKQKVEENKWKETSWHFENQAHKFNTLYEKYHFEYLLKSEGFQYDRAFLFDDGYHFTVLKDSSQKFIYAKLNEKEKIISLKGSSYKDDKTLINRIVSDIENVLNDFIHTLFYIYNNYFYYVNENRKNNEIKYSREEAIYTVLDVFNLSEEQKDYLYENIQRGSFLIKDNEIEKRRGFSFTEIEDSEYHDMKSIVHDYNFATTPEDVIIALSKSALVVGISATAKINTCIGNYDLKYLEKQLQKQKPLIDLPQEDFDRIASNFNALQQKYSEQCKIHTAVIDDLSCFSDKEKCKNLVVSVFGDNDVEEYINEYDAAEECYYLFLELKLAYVYKEACEKGIESFIAFTNSFPNKDNKFNLDRLQKMFNRIDEQYKYEKPILYIVRAQEFDEKFKLIQDDLLNGRHVFVITTYQTIGSGKNIQYEYAEISQDRVVDKSYIEKVKDFEGIYLVTPTHLIQGVNYNSEDKYTDLAKYLFHQEYLYQNKMIEYYKMKSNMEVGFRRTFYGDRQSTFYPQNKDVYSYTLKIIIQAVGRICRCRNKNKDIYIYSDREIVERIKIACEKESPKLMNIEFVSLLNTTISNSVDFDKIREYSMKNKKAFGKISQMAHTVRYSRKSVIEWQELRDFVLRNPTTNNPEKYMDLYFEFDETQSGYVYRINSNYELVYLDTNQHYDYEEVSEQSCDLPIILSIDSVKKMFVEKHYATRFKKAKYIMSPNLFKQVYLGALGEVVGKHILDRELGYDIQELDDVSFYEYFDFKLGKMYFDMKHWNKYKVDNDAYTLKVQRKLSRIKGSKCFVINLIKRLNATVKMNVGETVIQVPYLIDADTCTLNIGAIDEIRELYEYSQNDT